MAREMEVTQRLQETSLVERCVEASTQKLLQLCKRVELACNRIPGATTVERTAGVTHLVARVTKRRRRTRLES